MQYQTRPKNNNNLHLPPVALLYHVFGKRVAINGHFFRSPFISAASEQHLKLLEARFAAFMLNPETHLGLFHNQEQPKICCLMPGTPMLLGSSSSEELCFQSDTAQDTPLEIE